MNFVSFNAFTIRFDLHFDVRVCIENCYQTQYMLFAKYLNTCAILIICAEYGSLQSKFFLPTKYILTGSILHSSTAREPEVEGIRLPRVVSRVVEMVSKLRDVILHYSVLS